MPGQGPGGTGAGGGGMGGGAGGGGYGGMTIGGREQAEREKAAERKWQYDQAMMKANPANYALVQAMQGQAPWQSAFTARQRQPSPQMTEEPRLGGVRGYAGMIQKPPQQAPLAESGIGSVPSAKNLSLQTYQRMQPSQQEAFGSVLKAGGTTAQDFEEDMKKYRPAATQRGLGTARWA